MRRFVEPVACALFFLLLCLPVLQSATGLVAETELGGVVDPIEDADVSLATWNDGALQQHIEARFDRDLGLRGWMIRADNQLRMSLFGAARWPVIENDDWLISEGYLPGRSLAKDPAACVKLLLKAHNIKRLQDVMAEHGITLAVCISPSKVWVYPDRLTGMPAWAFEAGRGYPTYADVLRAGCASEAVHLIDFGVEFRSWRQTDPPGAPPLFAPGGIHWSNYGAARATVMLQQRLEQLGSFDWKGLEIRGLEDSPGPGEGEDDLVLLANLLDERPWRAPVQQPRLRLDLDDKGEPTGVLLVGSSFTWGLARALLRGHVAAPLAVRYYNRRQFEFLDGVMQPPVPIDHQPRAMRAALSRYRFVILERNESAIMDFDYGFVDAALRAFGLEPASFPPPELMHHIATRVPPGSG